MVWLRKVALIATLDTLRLDAITRSPINSLFASSLESLFTIRAYRQTGFFSNKFNSLVDRNASAYFSYCASVRWLTTHVDLINFIFVFASLAAGFIFKMREVDGALLALSLTSALSLMAPFQQMVKKSTEIANSMTSVERIQRYTALKK